MLSIDIIRLNLIDKKVEYFYELYEFINDYIINNKLDDLYVNITPSTLQSFSIIINEPAIPVLLTISNQKHEISLQLLFYLNEIEPCIYMHLLDANRVLNSYILDAPVKYETLSVTNPKFKLYYDSIIKKILPLHYFLNSNEVID